MKNQLITGHPSAKVVETRQETISKNTTLPITKESGGNEKIHHGLPVHDGRARAAGLRKTLEENAVGSETKAPAAAGTVIKYPADLRTGRRQRAEATEDLMPLDEEIHHLNGTRRNAQQERKLVLAQRRQANRGFKSVVVERTEQTDDLVTEGWGDDH